MRKFETILVTGGAGFIGHNFIRHVLLETQFSGKIINLDKMTYAANPATVKEQKELFGERCEVVVGDICDEETVKACFEKFAPDCVVHFAAESHVDRSILGPGEFIRTNIIGTYNLLEATRFFKSSGKNIHFHHISTDEVFGSLGETGFFTEQTAYSPNSPYSASKASSDHLVRAYCHTYNLNTTVSNCSNNYGPYHFPEKMIPLMIHHCLEGKPLPVYGNGSQVRDWLYVSDHAEAIWKIILSGTVGETYNIGGENEWKNIDLVETICERVSLLAQISLDKLKSQITFVTDRPGHDQRYAIDCSKIKSELEWKPRHSFNEGLDKTIQWYLDNKSWASALSSSDYQNWLQKNYAARK